MKKSYNISTSEGGSAMDAKQAINIEIKAEDLLVLKDILSNEVMTYSGFTSKEKGKNKDLDKYVARLKNLNSIVEKQLAYAGCM